mgnify:CR=1 FL=1
MALGLLGTAVFLAGVVLIAALQWIARKLARPLELPMDVVNGVLHGVGFLIIMPFVFSIFFFFFPAGLVLYWLVNNMLSIAQQWQIQRMFDRDKPAHAKR